MLIDDAEECLISPNPRPNVLKLAWANHININHKCSLSSNSEPIQPACFVDISGLNSKYYNYI